MNPLFRRAVQGALAVLVFATAAYAADDGRLPTIDCDAEWKDTSGNEILAQGGSVIKVGGLFYWYGVEFAGTRAQPIPKQIRCYTSPDLATWTYAGVVLNQHVAKKVRALPPTVAGGKTLLATREGANMVLATSASPTGPFSVEKTVVLPAAKGDGDLSFFQASDGAISVIYTVKSNDAGTTNNILCANLKSDGLQLGAATTLFANVPYGAPSVWVRDGVFYCMVGSIDAGWASSGTWYSTAGQLAGPWDKWKAIGRSIVCRDQLLATSFNSQPNTLLQVTGAQDTLLIYWGDRWSNFTSYGTGRYVCLPLDFIDGVPGMTWYRPWHPDVVQGTFTHELRRYALWREPPAPKKKK